MRKHSLNKPTLLKVLRTGLHELSSGNPAEAVSSLELARQLRLTKDQSRTLHKIIEQASYGTVDMAESWLEDLLYMVEPQWRDVNLRTAHLPKKLLFKFRPRRRVDGPGSTTNDNRAACGQAMLYPVNDYKTFPVSNAARLEILTDALANLLHWCDREGISFDEALRMARDHHAAER